MKKNLKQYFSFNRQERNGIIALLILLLILVLVNSYLPIRRNSGQYNFDDFKKQIAEFEKRAEEAEKKRNQKRESFDYTDVDESIARDILSPFPFNPNELPEKDWIRMGLPEKTVKTIINYRLKGGRFHKAEDLKKIYGLKESEFKVLKPFIKIEKSGGGNDPEYFAGQIQAKNFNPNIVTANDMRNMNLREDLIRNIINYRDKGGEFYDKEDVRKIYSMTDQEYQKLEPFITLSSLHTDALHDSSKNREFYKENILMIDLNTADTLDLQQLRGIGPKFASKIVKYRDLLGGYHSKNQLLEVYGMDSSRYELFSKNVFTSPDSLKKININKAGIKDLIRHPYIEYYLARSLVIYRDQNGLFDSIAEIVNAHLIYQELFGKLKPYLMVKNDNFEIEND